MDIAVETIGLFFIVHRSIIIKNYLNNIGNNIKQCLYSPMTRKLLFILKLIKIICHILNTFMLWKKELSKSRYIIQRKIKIYNNYLYINCGLG